MPEDASAAEKASIIAAMDRMIAIYEACELDRKMRRRGWTQEKVGRIVSHFVEYRDNLAKGRIPGS